VVLAAGHTDPARRAEALEILCRTYWPPLYAYVRRLGHPPPDAQDLTQGFFAHLLSQHTLEGLSPERGKFRSFLLTALKNFLVNERVRAHRLKRGGGQPAFSLEEVSSLDDETAEARFLHDAAVTHTPECVYDRSWALTLQQRALVRLQDEFTTADKAETFTRLSEFLAHEGSGADYAKVAQALHMTPGAVAVAVHRLRLRYREIVRDEIRHTVAHPAQVDEEMRYLVEVLCQ
jgi:RNA polymerase sigma-70 factor (ECF subfamily)